MKKQIFSLFLAVLLVAAITGCSSTQNQSDSGVSPQGTSAAMVGTPTLASTEPAAIPPGTSEPGGGSAAPTQESTATTVEPIETPTQESTATTEPIQTPPEQNGMTPTESSGLMTEEPATTKAMTATVEPPQAAVTAEPGQVLAPTGSVDVNRLSNLLDFEVWNRNNEQIGNVDAMVINQDTSQIEYVVIGVGGFLGLGEKEVPVPWQAFQLNANPMGTETNNSTTDNTQMTETHQNAFILDADKDRLDQAPDIDLNTIYQPETNDQSNNQAQTSKSQSFYEREQEINSFWQSNLSQSTNEMNNTGQNGQKMDNSTVGTAATAHLILADDLLGATLVNGNGQANITNKPDNNTTDMNDQSAEATQQPMTDTQMAAETQDLGKVQEVLVDTNTGKITYLLVSLNNIAAMPTTQQPGLAVTSEPPMTDTQMAAAGQWVFVPLQVVSWDSQNKELDYTGSQPVEQAPAISEQDLQNGVTPAMTAQADSFWGIDTSSASGTTQ